MTAYPLGRREAHDPNDALYPMAAVLPRVPLANLPTYRYWAGSKTHLDQTGDTCVANAWTHLLADSPRSHLLSDLDSDRPDWNLDINPAHYTSPQSGEHGFRGWLYDQAQQVDEFSDTPPAGGTSVRAGAKVLQQVGAVQSYHWASSIDDLVRALLTTGPVVIGTTWYNSMFNVEANGFINYDPSSGVAGGHCTKVDGINTTDQKARVKNSWGTNWGIGGYFWIKLPDLATLIENGEACIPIEA